MAVTPRRIAVDFDSTLAETLSFVCQLVNYREGTNFKPEEVDSWTFFQDHGYEKAFWGAYDLMDATHLRRAIRPQSPFACPTIKWLTQRGHAVELLTSNSATAVKDMQGWLFGHGLDIPVKALGRVSPHEKAALEYDLFIDDAPGLAEEMARRAYAHEAPRRMILVDQPYNRRFLDYVTVPSGRGGWPILRMRDWAVARELLLGMGF
jgi:5'(3')-deoxyribonucleotidase